MRRASGISPIADVNTGTVVGGTVVGGTVVVGVNVVVSGAGVATTSARGSGCAAAVVVVARFAAAG